MLSQQSIIKNIPKALETVDLQGFGKKYQGKVRDYYILKDNRVIVTTDRQSAFDRMLGLIPFKGQVLTQISKFWFDKTKKLVPNHLIKVPDPNVMIVKNCKLIPIEMVVRGYISGVTSTSIWTAYQKGERVIYGIKFPEGLQKNQKLKHPIITPTTKAESGHDEKITEEDIIKRKIVSPKIWREMKKAALTLFERGTKICAKAGIILVDTKYEFGLDQNGKLTLIDEIHTPDSSRFWIKATYRKKFSSGEEPENFDKEFLRLWFREQGYKDDGEPPKMPLEFIAKVSERYMAIYEKITGEKFIPDTSGRVEERIRKNLKKLNTLSS